MLGMVTPTFVMETFETIVGRREAELALGLAKLYSPQQAYDAGLIGLVINKILFFLHMSEKFEVIKFN